MKKLLTVLFVCVFIASFAVGTLFSTVDAQDCIATCFNGTLLVCCPDGGGWSCDWDGPCDWPGWIP